jgi:hypothetical protein
MKVNRIANVWIEAASEVQSLRKVSSPPRSPKKFFICLLPWLSFHEKNPEIDDPKSRSNMVECASNCSPGFPGIYSRISIYFLVLQCIAWMSTRFLF